MKIFLVNLMSTLFVVLDQLALVGQKKAMNQMDFKSEAKQFKILQTQNGTPFSHLIWLKIWVNYLHKPMRKMNWDAKS